MKEFNEEYVREFIGKEIGKMFDLMEKYNISTDEMLEFFKKVNTRRCVYKGYSKSSLSF